MERRKTIDDLMVTALLKPGRDNAVHQSDLCYALGCKPAALKCQIRKERLSGSLICSDLAGYYLASGPEEIEAFIRLLRKHALTRLGSLREFRQAVRVNSGMPGQITVDQLMEKHDSKGDDDGRKG